MLVQLQKSIEQVLLEESTKQLNLTSELCRKNLAIKIVEKFSQNSKYPDFKYRTLTYTDDGEPIFKK